MRTTLTLESDVAERLRQEARRHPGSFKKLVNEVLRRGLGLVEDRPRKTFRVKEHSSPFVAGIDPGKLNQLVDELEIDAFNQKARKP